MPLSDHSNDCSGGAAKISKRRAVSAPYFSMIDSGVTTLPLDLDIFAPSFNTIPWVKSRVKGSSPLTNPSSRITLKINRA